MPENIRITAMAMSWLSLYITPVILKIVVSLTLEAAPCTPLAAKTTTKNMVLLLIRVDSPNVSIEIPRAKRPHLRKSIRSYLAR